MVVYLGTKPVGVNKVVEKEVAKTKFNVGIDDFIGNVDENGKYKHSLKEVVMNLTGVKTIDDFAFAYRFAYSPYVVFRADDVTKVNSYAFNHAFIEQGVYHTITLSFDSLEVVDKSNAFSYACSSRTSVGEFSISFNKLKKVSGDSAFSNFAQKISWSNFDKFFPVLEEISGNSAMNGAFNATANGTYTFQNIKKINGATSSWSATIGSFYVNNTVWKFPNATEFTGYIWDVSTSYPGEIHFAAANQVAIESCDGYANKWGFTGATIYFDL